MSYRFKIIKIQSTDQGMENDVKLAGLLLDVTITVLVILKANHNEWLVVPRSQPAGEVEFVIVGNFDLQ